MANTFQVEAVLRYRVYQIECGLLVEPKGLFHRDRRFSDYETMEDALTAIADEGGEYVVLPSVFTRPNWLGGNE